MKYLIVALILIVLLIVGEIAVSKKQMVNGDYSSLCTLLTVAAVAMHPIRYLRLGKYRKAVRKLIYMGIYLGYEDFVFRKIEAYENWEQMIGRAAVQVYGEEENYSERERKVVELAMNF